MAREFLGNIKGEQGEQGLPGQDGAPGEQGEQGVPGQDGAKGDPGEKGETGAPGVDGKDGVTPTFELEANGDLYVVTPD